MKKITQLLVSLTFMLLITQITFSQIEYKLDSIQRFDWNTNTSAFEMTDREHFTYDNGGTKETFGISYMFNGSVWGILTLDIIKLIMSLIT